MGQLNGYASVPHNTYDAFRAYALANGVNVDYSYGNQCWDICALLWWQYGLRLETGNGLAYGCWTLMRYTNARGPFKLIYNIGDVRRGDVLVFNGYGSYYTGHIGFADENYRGGNTINLLGQNQGQGISWGKTSIVKPWSLTHFLGAFRNSNWSGSPPTPGPTPPGPPSPVSKLGDGTFPWVLYAEKLRKTNML